jgi:DNA primase large subunit
LSAESIDHGCPYRTFKPDALSTSLLSTYSSNGLNAGHLPEIMTMVKGHHYHSACTRVFEITHAQYPEIKKGEGTGGNENVLHPNQYAARSIELEKAAKKGKDAMDVD